MSTLPKSLPHAYNLYIHYPLHTTYIPHLIIYNSYLFYFIILQYRIHEYVKRGVHLSFPGNGDFHPSPAFSRDLEPEYVTLNKGETHAYVTLQVR